MSEVICSQFLNISYRVYIGIGFVFIGILLAIIYNRLIDHLFPNYNDVVKKFNKSSKEEKKKLSKSYTFISTLVEIIFVVIYTVRNLVKEFRFSWMVFVVLINLQY